MLALPHAISGKRQPSKQAVKDRSLVPLARREARAKRRSIARYLTGCGLAYNRQACEPSPIYHHLDLENAAFQYNDAITCNAIAYESRPSPTSSDQHLSRTFRHPAGQVPEAGTRAVVFEPAPRRRLRRRRSKSMWCSNLWFDHGMARGGNIIDLVIEMRRVTVKEALAILESGFGGSVPAHAPACRKWGAPAVEKEKEDRGSKSSTSVWPKHPALIQYLENRCIDIAVAKQFLKEIRFRRVGQAQDVLRPRVREW